MASASAMGVRKNNLILQAHVSITRWFFEHLYTAAVMIIISRLCSNAIHMKSKPRLHSSICFYLIPTRAYMPLGKFPFSSSVP